MICIFGQWESLGRNADADLTDDPARIEWREFCELPRYGMVKAFEGAYMYARGIWRPETNSCMNNNVSYFNAPSRKKIVERIMELSGRSFDMNDFLAKDAINLSTSARSRLREPRAGELFVPFAPPVLTVGAPGDRQGIPPRKTRRDAYVSATDIRVAFQKACHRRRTDSPIERLRTWKQGTARP